MSLRLTSLLLVFLAIPCSSYAQTVQGKQATTTSVTEGHTIGESVSELLKKEPSVQQQANACQRDMRKTNCDRLIAAITRGDRAQVSTPDSTTFILDGGKLVKLTAIVNEDADKVQADLSRQFGTRSSLTAFPMRNTIGEKWEDRLTVWDTPAVYVGLREDNNPASQNHHLVLAVESQAEHTREHSEPGEEADSR